MSGWVKSFTHLKDRPHGDRALEMLQRIASLVKPIMRAKGWVLPVLSEFFPSNPGLLGMNVNHGQKIYLRLRPAHRPDSFYDDEEVVGTMLHELTHNVHGPHDDHFYKYLAQLEDDYYKLKLNGYTGEGFHSVGKRLGQNVGHNVPMHQAKSQAVQSAEKRRNAAAVMGGSGGRKLGGLSNPLARGKTPRELAAEAAERRVRDEKTCGSTSQEEAIERESQLAIEQSILDIPDFDVPPSPRQEASSSSLPTKRPVQSPERASTDPGPKPPKRPRINDGISSASREAAQRRLDGVPSNSRAPTTSVPKARPRANIGQLEAGMKNWECQICTLVNRPFALTCEACGMNKPVDPSIGWTCLECGEVGNQVEWWTCAKCGRMKSEVAGG